MRIVEQNVQQFSELVNETFPNVSLDGHFSSDTCTGFVNSGMRLACFWSQVQSLDTDSPHFQDIRSQALGMVCYACCDENIGLIL